jgi:hypothetical protein
MYAGSADAIFPLVEETVVEMPNVTFVDLPGLAHSETNAHSELVVPHVIEFLARVGREAV